MKHTGLGWMLVLAAYAVFTLICAGLALLCPAWGLWPVQLWRLGTALFWMFLAMVRVVLLAAVLLTKNREKR